MKKIIAIFLILVGIISLIKPIYEWIGIRTEEQIALAKAESIINTNDEKTIYREKIENFRGSHGKAFGVLYIPKFEKRIAIIEGVRDTDLNKGIGHISESKYPLQNDQIYLAVHRDKVFKEIQNLNSGDYIYIEMPYSKVKYKISHNKIVNPEDTQVIKSTYPKEELVIQTCYPFNFIGNAPKRYLLYAYPY